MEPASQDKVSKRQKVLNYADNFINDLKLLMEPMSLNFGSNQLNKQIVKEGQNSMPFNMNVNQILSQPLHDVEINVQFLKRVRQAKLNRFQFQRQREVRSSNNKAFQTRLKALEDQQKNNLEERKLTLSQNNFLPGKFLRNILIGDYQYFCIQRFTDWFPLKARVIKQIDELKKLQKQQDGTLKKLFYFLKNDQSIKTNQFQSRINSIINLSFLFIQNWYYGQTHQTRIIAIHKDPDIEQGHFYVYYNSPSQPLQFQSALNLKNRLLMTYFAQKHQNNAAEINNNYLTNTRAEISNQIVFKHLKDNFIVAPPPIEVVSLKNHQRIYSDFGKQSVTGLIEQWKNKSYFYLRNSKDYVYIQPMFIYLPKSYLARSVKLVTSNVASQQFTLLGQNDKSFVFQARNKQVYAFQLQKFQQMGIEFNAQIVNQYGKSNQFKNKIDISKIENQVLGFSYELGLIPDDIGLVTQSYKDDFPFVLAFQAVMKRASQFQTPQNLKIYRQVNLLTNIGKIPNIYSSYFYYNYTPEIHPLISQIITGAPTAVTQKSFQATYIDFVNFLQRQQNKSQNYCEYLRIKKAKPSQNSGFVMRERYTKYCQFLNQGYQNVSKNFQQIFTNYIQIPKIVGKKQMKNLQNDMKYCDLANAEVVQQILQKYIIYQCISKKDLKTRSHISTNPSLIKIADRVIQIYLRSDQSQKNNSNQIAIFFITFMQATYPYYFNPKSLQQQLIHLRLLTQKYIPQFNYLLNRKGIGLENYASSHLLQLFTSLPIQLCYRFWDHMLSNSSRLQHTKLYCIYTLMLYQQKANLLPIFPINQIIDSVSINSNKIKFDQTAFYNMSQVIQNYHVPVQQRQGKVVQLAKYRFLRKFVFGTNSKTQMLDQDQFQRQDTFNNTKSSINNNINTANAPQYQQRIHTKLTSLKGISYPLPTALYPGFPITKIYLFIGGVFLLNNLNLQSREYKMQVNLSGGTSLTQIPIRDKSSFVNKFIQFDYSDVTRIIRNSNNNNNNGNSNGNNVSNNNNARLVVEFRIIQKPSKQLLNARLRLGGYHKDVVYRENVVLNKSQKVKDYQLNNLGTSVINLAVLTRSQNNDNSSELEKNQEKVRKQTQYYQKLLDFDLSAENNQIIKSMAKLDKKIKKIMDPLDQLDVDKYLRLKISTSFNYRVPEWIRISRVSIQQLKAIFAFIFSQQAEKSIRLNFSKFYQNYSQNYQKFDLGKFLLDLILMCQIPKLTKLNMIYCLTVHYQNIISNSTSQQMSVQTLNSIIKQIMTSTGFLNACPFSNIFAGQILSGYYYLKGNKVQENKQQITEILQDWAYVCQIKSDYCGMILGSVQDLSVLRAMLPINILRQIQQQQLCRFQIQYKIAEQVYIWSSTVNTSDFSIQKRGVKFLSNYPKYIQQPTHQSLTSIADTLYNTQNLIPLQSHTTTIDLDEFIQIFNKWPLLDYLLTYNQYMSSSMVVESRDKNNFYGFQIRKTTGKISKMSSSQGRAMFQNFKSKDQFYSDFAIFRNQNCIPSWRKCKVINDQGKTLALVTYQNKKGQYLVPRYEIICLDEIQIANKGNAQTEFSETQISDKSLKR